MAEAALAGTLRTLGAKDGYVLLDGAAVRGASHTSARGFFRRHYAKAFHRPYANLSRLVGREVGSINGVFRFTRARNPGRLATRNLYSASSLGVMRDEGLRTLLVFGTRDVREDLRRAPGRPAQVEVLSARGSAGRDSHRNQVSVALENWSLNRAAAQRDEELRILYDVGRAMRETFNLKAQFEILRSAMKDLLGGTDFALAMQEMPEGPLETAVPFERGSGLGQGPRRWRAFGEGSAADPLTGA